jgi:hypothetical protein
MKTNKIVSIKKPHRKMIGALYVLLLLLFAGCAGGFGKDSSNAEEFKGFIFGPDTIVQQGLPKVMEENGDTDVKLNK